MSKLLLVEDDETLSKNIRDALTEENFSVEFAYDGIIAEKILKKSTFDCVILDINIPGKNGFEVCKTFRTHNQTTPVIMLTAFDELEDKIQGFESGTNDYLTKPFYMRELLLRIEAAISSRKSIRNNSIETTTLTHDDLCIHLKTKKVSRQGIDIQLTPREYQILKILVENKGELVSKQDLIKEIWGNIVDANTNTIEVYINFLRSKIDKPFEKHSIKTKIGYGYYIE